MGNTESALGALRAAGRRVTFRRGDRLITVGAASDEVLVVEDGLVKVVLPAERDVEPVVGLFGPGRLLGELGVINREPRTATVVALRPGEATKVAATTFLRLRCQLPAIQALIDASWIESQRRLDLRHHTQALDVPIRVATALLTWAAEFGHRDRAGLTVHGISQRDVAGAVTASEKSVEAAYAALRRASLLRTRRLAYLLPAPEALARLVTRPDWRP